MRYVVTGGSGFIGTNLVEELLAKGQEVLNLDVKPPQIDMHMSQWREVDILECENVLAAFREFRPDFVVHLAARTDTCGADLSEYAVNTKGSENVLAAINTVGSVKRAVITSTQFVNQYNGVPKNEMDFAPHTVYGESKVIMERMTREAELECAWTIIRPTNIWGPWHSRYPHEFWRIVGKGLYFHPNLKDVIRSYGYVKNVTYQINKILEAELELVSRQVFYVGDEPIDQFEWVNGFSKGLIGKEVRVIPVTALRVIALFGDMLSILRVKFPITSSRFKSLTTSNGIPMNRTISAFGNPPYSLDAGIKETVEWLKRYHPNLVSTN